MSIGAAFALVIFAPTCEMTLLIFELALATRVMREAVEQGGSLPVLPFYLRSACRAQNTSALRTHALFPRIRYALLRGADSFPIASLGPFRRSSSVALGVGRDGTPSGQVSRSSPRPSRRGSSSPWKAFSGIAREMKSKAPPSNTGSPRSTRST
jgi:hypothetical protein